MTSADSMDEFIARLARWAEARPDLRAAMIVGSRARSTRPADEWADVDVLLVADDPQPYLASGAWLSDLGRVRLTFLEPTAVGGLVERRVLFEPALDADLSFLPRAMLGQLAQAGLPADIGAVFARGARLLFDKDGTLGALLAALLPAPAAAQPPTAITFDNLVNDMLYHAIWAAKKLRRGELYVARSCCDGYMKVRLLELISWHTRVQQGWGTDTWHNGRFIEQWADARVLAGLRNAYAHYDADDITQAIHATLGLFGWVARETADRLGYTYPLAAHEYTERWLAANLPSLPGSRP